MKKTILRRGFTLVETLIVVSLCIAILIPAYQVFRTGSQTSMKGMKRIDLVLEARRILRLVHDDLKQGCFISGGDATEFDLNDMFTATDFPAPSFSFPIFPRRVEPEKVISSTITAGEAPRYVSRVTYKLEPSPNLKLAPYQIVREEQFPSALNQESQKKVLSQRVAMFSIRPILLQTQVRETNNQWAFAVTLQLCELSPNVNMNQTQRGEMITNTTSGVVLADFYDLVFPVQFNARWNHQYETVNWYDPLQGPN